MKLTGREDVDAPIAHVFARLADFEAWERGALRRGAEVQRTDALTRAGRGMAWSVTFAYRGKPRRMDLRLTDLTAPLRLGFAGTGANLAGTLAVELIEMAPRRTRITLRLEVRPLTLGARLFVQSLKLARGRVEKRLHARVAQIAAEIEARYGRGAA